MSPTTLLFLCDTFQFEAATTVTTTDEDEDGHFFTTNATIFYPGGGGQEPDKGAVTTADGTHIPIVKAFLKNRKMHHYYADGTLRPGESVHLQIDAEHRLQNARLHTGGHLLSSVVSEKLGLPMIPVKGFHYQQGAYVEFDPQEENLDIHEEEENIHRALMEDISGKLAIETAVVPVTDPLFEKAFKPEGFIPPENAPLRLVKIGPYAAIPCGGTHLHHTGELGFLSLKHIRHKKGRIRISYQVGG